MAVLLSVYLLITLILLALRDALLIIYGRDEQPVAAALTSVVEHIWKSSVHAAAVNSFVETLPVISQLIGKTCVQALGQIRQTADYIKINRAVPAVHHIRTRFLLNKQLIVETLRNTLASHWGYWLNVRSCLWANRLANALPERIYPE